MSYDPYEGQFGVGEIGGGLEGGEMEDITSQFSVAEQLLGSMAESLGTISKSLEGFQPVAKEMTKSKFEKSTKGLKGMFKSMDKASLKSSGISLLLNTLKPLLDLFKPFQVILDLISSLLKVMVGEALGPMFEALQPLFDALIGLMPIFAELGGAIGGLIAMILEPLVEIFLALMPVVEPIIGLIISLITLAMEPLRAIFDALMPVILPIIDTVIDLIIMALEPLETIMDALLPIIEPLINLALIPLKLILSLVEPLLSLLAPVFNLIGEAVKPLEPIITLISTAIENFIGWLDDLLGSFGEGNIIERIEEIGGISLEGLTWDDILDLYGNVVPDLNYEIPEGEEVLSGGELLGLQEGGIVLSEGVYKVGEEDRGEVVIPLSKLYSIFSTTNALLSSLNDEMTALRVINQQLLKKQHIKNVFEGL